MSKKIHLVPAALLTLLVGILAILHFRGPASTPAVPATPGAAAPEKAAARAEPAKEALPRAEAGPRVRGRVIAANQAPIEGAWIWIGRGHWSLAHPLGATTKDGSYDLLLPASDLPNYLQIHVLAEGFRPDTRKSGPLVGERGPTIVLHPSPVLRGVVLEQGTWRSIGGVVVQAKQDVLDHEVLLEVRARGDGTFEMGSLPAENFTLSVRGVGHQAFTSVREDGSPVPLGNVPTAVADLYRGRAILALPLTGTASVFVKDEAGKPVAGAEVRNVEAEKTDAEGGVRLELLPEGDCGVSVSGDGYTPTVQEFRITAQADTRVDVVLKKGGARLFGTIRVAEGQPAPRSVEVWPGVLGHEGAHCRHAEISSGVAAGCSYSIPVPHGQPVRLVVRFDGKHGEARIPWFDRGAVTLAYGQSQERNLLIDALCKLRIAVKDPKGRPVAGASVRWHGGTMYQFERENFSGTLTEGEAARFGETLGDRRQGNGVTDAEGVLSVCVVKGEYSVQVTHGEFKPHKGERFPVGGDATRDVVLDRALRVSGRLSTWDGKPADGWWVGLSQGGNDGKSVTDGEGAFTLDSVEPGARKVQVCWPRYIQTEVMTQDVDVREGMGVLELRLPPLPMLRGRLRGFRLQDLGEARLECSAGDEQVGFMSIRVSGSPDAQGEFLLGPLPAATYYYTLDVRWKGLPQPYIASRGKVTIVPQRETTLDFDCEAPGSIVVDIDIADTSRYDRYELVLKRPNGDYVSSAGADAAPSAAGKQRIELLVAPGKYLVDVRGSVNDREDRARKVHSETVTLEAAGKVVLKASSR